MAWIDTDFGRHGQLKVAATEIAPLSVTETWWGYVVRSERAITSSRRLLTVVAGFFSIAFAIAGAALWLAPAGAFSGDVVLMKGAGSSLMAMVALLLSRLATEDPVVEIQVDCRKKELREVARRKGQPPRMLGRYEFEEIGGVFFDRTAKGRLVARYRNTPHLITIAEGAGPALQRIHDRMGRDLMGAPISG